jgi:cbb3-type cytochrome oxidase subunit 3
LATYLAGEQIDNPILGPLKLKSGVAFFQSLVPGLISILLFVGVLIFVFYLFIGAISWIYSEGDKAKLEEAKQKITNAIIGIIVLFSVFALIKVIEIFFGIHILTIDLSTVKLQ